MFGEPDIEIEPVGDNQIRVKIKGVDVFNPQTGEIDLGGPDTIALWFIDTDYNEESFFVRHAYFLGAATDPYKALKTTLKAEIDEEAWASLRERHLRPFPKPKSGRIAVKVINHLGDEVMKVFSVREGTLRARCEMKWTTKTENGDADAGSKAAETKGPEERKRAALMAAWTRKHGKNDAENPHSKAYVRQEK